MGLSPTCTLNQLTEGSLLVRAGGPGKFQLWLTFEATGFFAPVPSWSRPLAVPHQDRGSGVFLLLFGSNFIYFWLHCFAWAFL